MLILVEPPVSFANPGYGDAATEAALATGGGEGGLGGAVVQSGFSVSIHIGHLWLQAHCPKPDFCARLNP
jgi:hypothetical protein